MSWNRRRRRTFGSGWISGVAALVGSVAGLFFVLCLRYPTFLAVPPLREYYQSPWFRVGLHFLLIGSFLTAIVSLILRASKTLGYATICITLLAMVLRSRVESRGELTGGVFLGLDWFVLNVILTGVLFIPLERISRVKGQGLFREEWREDLFYYFVSSLMVQVLTFLSMTPALELVAHTHWTSFARGWRRSR